MILLKLGLLRKVFFFRLDLNMRIRSPPPPNTREAMLVTAIYFHSTFLCEILLFDSHL